MAQVYPSPRIPTRLRVLADRLETWWEKQPALPNIETRPEKYQREKMWRAKRLHGPRWLPAECSWTRTGPERIEGQDVDQVDGNATAGQGRGDFLSLSPLGKTFFNCTGQRTQGVLSIFSQLSEASQERISVFTVLLRKDTWVGHDHFLDPLKARDISFP